jgi:hypothetical protein
MYEFVRALCQVGTDPNFDERKPADPGTKEKILEDLRVAAHWQDIRRVIEEDERLSGWLKANHVPSKSLLLHRSGE